MGCDAKKNAPFFHRKNGILPKHHTPFIRQKPDDSYGGFAVYGQQYVCHNNYIKGNMHIKKTYL